MTQSELEALPERVAYELETLPTGETVRHPRPPTFNGRAPNGGDTVFFRDSTGTSWFVDHYLEGGPYKRRAFLE